MKAPTALDKAKGALGRAAEVWAEMHKIDNRRCERYLDLREDYMELTTLAQIQANVAQAEALAAIAAVLTKEPDQ